MRERSGSASGRPASLRPVCSIDVITVTPRGRQLSVLFVRADEQKSRARWELPWESAHEGDLLGEVAHRIVRAATASDAAWLEQVGAFGAGRRHPSGGDISVAYVAVVAHGDAGRIVSNASWRSAAEVPSLSPRQRGMLDQGLAAIRTRMDYAPIAFRLLAPMLTLGELQQVYELLLGRKLHKASFRRALQASYLVEPTNEWRREGRGRPAQLFRYAPRNHKGGRRAVRFDLLS